MVNKKNCKILLNQSNEASFQILKPIRKCGSVSSLIAVAVCMAIRPQTGCRCFDLKELDTVVSLVNHKPTGLTFVLAIF